MDEQPVGKCQFVNVVQDNAYFRPGIPLRAIGRLPEVSTMKLCRLLVSLTFVMLSVTALAAQDKLIIFGGYSYVRPPVTVTETNCPIGNFECPTPPVFIVNSTNRQNLNGWELTGSYRILPFFGIAADFAGHYGSSLSNSSSNVHQYTYLFGPEVALPARVSPFAHLLFGGVNQSVSSGIYNPSGAPSLFVLPKSNSAFATALGAGIDLKVIPHLWLRPIQIDYLLTKLNSSTQNSPRISAGVVFHF